MRQRLGALLAIGVFAGVAASAPAAAATSGTPYRDPDAHGSIGLCDRAGNPITHGSVTATPFAWRAVSSVAAPAGYGGAGRTATLLAYQPRRGVASGEWSGDQLTSASRYTNPAHPIAAATKGDESLQGFLTEFSPKWDGLLQLRLYLGAPDQPPYSQTYPSLDIKVTGKTWHAVDGTSVSCHSGKSVSLESIVLSPKSTAGATKTAPTARSTTAPSDTSSSPAASSTTVASGSSSSSNGDGPLIAVAVVAGVVVLGGGGWAARHRIAGASSRTASAPPSEPSKKGR